MTARESVIEAHSRWEALKLVQLEYRKFSTFLYDVINGLMGFECTPVQIDIGEYMEHGPDHAMVQAQRGQAKTTIAACYAVWRLIHQPNYRVLIISAGGEQATEIANWIIQIIENMDVLECMRPDTSVGDRSSVKAYDIHYSLKGPEKSPSVACIGITGNLQGKRADLLIPDDIESQKNSQTQVQQERIKHLSKDFTSICSNGKIIYLGTPQNIDSIYNDLPGRGYDIRIWPGRYPTAKEMPNYGMFLAPSIQAKITADPSLQYGGGPLGDRGQPIDPVLLGEEALTKKEIDQGKAYFQLQHMLDTKLMDADRYPLKSNGLVFMSAMPDRAPMLVNWSTDVGNLLEVPKGFPLRETYYRGQVSADTQWGPFQGCHMRVDPAGGGQNGDEIGYAVTKFIAGHIWLVAIGGLLGGMTDDNMDKLTEIAVKHKPDQIDVEENFGKGAFNKLWQPKLLAALKKVNHSCGIEDVWESGQKELRIIDTLEPIISSHRLIVDINLLEQDVASLQHYPLDVRNTYSLFWQLARVTREKRALLHDDRLDALAGSVGHWVEHLVLDRAKEQARAKQAEWKQLMKNPLGNGRALNLRGPGGFIKKTPGILARVNRKMKHGRSSPIR